MMNFFRRKADDGLWEETNTRVMTLARERKADEALSLAKELYEYSVKSYGKKHQKTVKAINNLGYVLSLKKEFDEAESYLLMALQISEKVYGKYSKEVAFVTMNLSKLYMAKANEIMQIEQSFQETKQQDSNAEGPNLAEALR